MVMVGSVMLGQGAPCMEALAGARGVASIIFSIIDRVRISLFCDSFDSGITEFNPHNPCRLKVSER